MISLFDRVVLVESMDSDGLRPDDIGTVVEIYGEGEGYEVEFFTLKGETRAVLAVTKDQVREIDEQDVPQARKVEAA